jgi:hypothetical protein
VKIKNKIRNVFISAAVLGMAGVSFVEDVEGMFLRDQVRETIEAAGHRAVVVILPEEAPVVRGPLADLQDLVRIVPPPPMVAPAPAALALQADLRSVLQAGAEFFIRSAANPNNRDHATNRREKESIDASLRGLIQQLNVYALNQIDTQERALDANHVLFDTTGNNELILTRLVGFFNLANSAVDNGSGSTTLNDSYGAFETMLTRALLARHNAKPAFAGALAANLTPQQWFEELSEYVDSIANSANFYTNPFGDPYASPPIAATVHPELNALVQAERANPRTNPAHLQLEVDSNVQWHLFRYYIALVEGGDAGALDGGHAGVSNYTPTVLTRVGHILSGL